MSFRFLEHTADIVLEVEAPSLSGLLEEASRGLTDCITELEGVQPRTTMQVRKRAVDREGLLVGWLNELLYRFEIEGFLARDAEVDVRSDHLGLQAVGRLRGEAYDSQRHAFRTAVKAATWHNLKVETDGVAWHAVVVLDI